MRKENLKKILFGIMLMMCMVQLRGNGLDSLSSNSQSVKHSTKKEIVKEHNWSAVINVIAKVESNHNPKAVSKSGKYVGYLQISVGLVNDCNNYLKRIGSTKRFTPNDRYNKEKSIEMFVIYQKIYNKSNSTEKAIRIWNGGSGYSVKGTQAYYEKVMKHLKA